MKSHSAPIAKADLPHFEWTRKTQSPSYVHKAKHLARLMKTYLMFARPHIPPFVDPPTRREFNDTLHNALEPLTFEDRRRGRGDRERDRVNLSPSTEAPPSPLSSDWKAPTSSMKY